MKRTTDPNPPGVPAIEGGPSGYPEVDRRAPLAGLSLVPTKIFFTKGVGSHRDELRSHRKVFQHKPPRQRIGHLAAHQAAANHPHAHHRFRNITHIAVD